jgi:predicted lipid carrier protein YhbT
MTDQNTLTADDLGALRTAGRDELRAAVDGVPREDLAALLATDAGTEALRAAFEKMPSYHTGETVDPPATARWQVSRAPGAELAYDVLLTGASCTVEPARDETTPDVTMSTDAVSFIEIAAGLKSGVDLLMQGRLQVAGDAALAMRMESVFGLGA